MPLNIVNAEAVFTRGVSAHSAGRFAEAEQCYRQVLQIDPNHAGATQNFGVLAFQMGHSNQAIPILQRAIHLVPNDASVYCNLGDAFTALQFGDDAINAYEKAIAIDPTIATAYNNLAIVYSRLGKVGKAIGLWQKSIELAGRPELNQRLVLTARSTASMGDGGMLKAAAYNNLGNAYLQRMEPEKARECHRLSVELNHEYSNAHSNMLRDMNHIVGITPAEHLEAHRAWWKMHAAGIAHLKHANNRDPERKLRIGFVSSDFREHSVTHFLLPLFENLDRSAFDIICYAGVNRPDDWTRRVQGCATLWRNALTNLDEDLARSVQADQVDILFDLAGHTSDNRLRSFAFKAAPIQINYLGYPLTTGSSDIDYRIADPIADPPGVTDSHYSEKLLRLPKTMWCYRPPVEVPADEIPPAVRHSDRPFTFGSFNNCSKMSPATFDLWAHVLKAVPNSRLILKASAMADDDTRELIMTGFTARGIGRERIQLMQQQLKLAEHFSYYDNIDLGLDTVPYNGTTTTCEALWMNVPVVVLAGDMHISRVGASLLTNSGFPQLVAQTPDDFVAIAAGLGNNISALTDLRKGLRAKFAASPIMDGKAFARDFSAALRGVWRTWCEHPS